ncbi:MAG TPA: cytochrome d ubiquinol oxidase subunit II, partial [Blastocatellia bacterium]|nr:cytochrome d ubiquinol oxidase subunit II [Blastocatellia bacterium]
ETGILDWFTVLSGVVAFLALAVHGANYLALKTEGDMNQRARRVVGLGWFALVAVTLISLWAVMYVRPTLLDNYFALPVGWLIPIAVVASLAAIKYFNTRGDDKKAFLSSSVYLATMLGGAVYGLFPLVLPALEPANSLTVYNARAGDYGLSVALIWWPIGIIIALGYYTFLFRTFKGKVSVGQEH